MLGAADRGTPSLPIPGPRGLESPCWELAADVPSGPAHLSANSQSIAGHGAGKSHKRFLSAFESFPTVWGQTAAADLQNCARPQRAHPSDGGGDGGDEVAEATTGSVRVSHRQRPARGPTHSTQDVGSVAEAAGAQG